MFNIEAIPAFDDNYIWLISDDDGRAVIVDPGEDEPVVEVIRERAIDLAAILITHKHYDHIGGIGGIKSAFPDSLVFGPQKEAIPGVDIHVTEGMQLDIPEMYFRPKVIEVPGHTEGHIAYYEGNRLFCGDTLFACGCGRVFSGTMVQLYHSLHRISRLPENTLIYCAHEYTLDNIGFAKWVEPENPDLIERQYQVIAVLEEGQETVPSLLATELRTNPFLRVNVNNIHKAAERYAGRELDSSINVFRTLRQWKDREYD